MTKARTSAAKIRDKKAAAQLRRGISLPGGEVAPNPLRGGDRRNTQDPPEPANTVALDARRRHSPMKDANDATSPLYGCDMGRCIIALHPRAADHMPLWDVWQSLNASRANYHARILSCTGNPQGAAIAMIPEAMQADTGHTVDLRTAEEKDASAKRAHAYWRSLMAKLPTPQHRWALMPAQDADEGALWRDRAPTAWGVAAVASLVLLARMHTRA